MLFFPCLLASSFPWLQLHQLLHCKATLDFRKALLFSHYLSMSVVTSWLKSKETWTTKPSPKGRDVKSQRGSIAQGSQLHEGEVPLVKLLKVLQKRDSVM